MDWLTKILQDPALWWPAVALILAAAIYKFAGGEDYLKKLRERRALNGQVKAALRDEGQSDPEQLRGVVLTRMYIEKLEERAAEHYANVQAVQTLQLHFDRLRRRHAQIDQELQELALRLDTTGDRVTNLGSDYVEIKTLLQELGTKVDQYAVPMKELVGWLARRRAGIGPDTP